MIVRVLFYGLNIVYTAVLVGVMIFYVVTMGSLSAGTDKSAGSR